MRRRATWVLVDQGIVSAGNFLTGNLLGRTLPEAQFGTFGLLLETMLYLNSLQAALVIYPLTIKGATGQGKDLGRLATAATLFTCLLLPLLGGATIISLHAMHAGALTIAAIAAMFLWQLQETLRRGLIADLRYADSVWGDGISYLGQAGALFVLRHMGLLSLQSALLVMGITSALAITLQALQIGMKRISMHEAREVAIDFWRLGRWMLPTNAGSLITSLGYWWVLQWTHGPAACGVFNAIVQMFKVANPVMSSMNGLIVPAVARASAREGPRAVRRIALRYTGFGAALLCPYFLFLAVFPTFALRLFYRDDSPYVGNAMLLQLFVANYTMIYVSSAAGAWLSGLGHSRSNFSVQLCCVIVTVFVGLPLTALWGPLGLIVGSFFAAASMALYSIWMIRKTQGL